MNKKKFLNGVLFLLGVVIVAYLGMFLFLNSTTIAPPGTTAAKVTLGSVDKEAHQGFFWRAPFVSHAVIVNTKQQTAKYGSQNLKTRDLQNIGLNCAVIYQINSEKVPQIVADVEPEKIDTLLLFPRIGNALQEIIGKNDVYLLVTQQEMVREATKYVLADLLSVDGYITVKDVMFQNLKFSSQFEETIEKKLTEAQLLEIARIQTLKVEEEAKQIMALASVDLDVLKKRNCVLTNPLVVKYEATKLLQKWNGELPSSLIVSGQETVLPIVSNLGNVKR